MQVSRGNNGTKSLCLLVLVRRIKQQIYFSANLTIRAF